MRKLVTVALIALIGLASQAEDFKVNGITLGSVPTIKQTENGEIAFFPGNPEQFAFDSKNTQAHVPSGQASRYYCSVYSIPEAFDLFGMTWRKVIFISSKRQVFCVRYRCTPKTFSTMGVDNADFNKSSFGIVVTKTVTALTEKYGKGFTEIKKGADGAGDSLIIKWVKGTVHIYFVINEVRMKNGAVSYALGPVTLDYFDTMLGKEAEVTEQKEKDLANKIF